MTAYRWAVDKTWVLHHIIRVSILRTAKFARHDQRSCHFNYAVARMEHWLFREPGDVPFAAVFQPATGVMIQSCLQASTVGNSPVGYLP
ncbi:hypothetical protein IF2G_05837 [Cordyceps javanica]|nr:hypothetical protein IF2G_05837 [Cordyceps javanica]